MINEEVPANARSDLARRSAALARVQFEDVLRLSCSFEEIRAGFGRGALSAKITEIRAEGINSAAI